MDTVHNMPKDIQHIMASSRPPKKPSSTKRYLLYAIAFLILAVLVFLGLPVLREGKWQIQKRKLLEQEAPPETTNTAAPPQTVTPPEVIKNLTAPPPAKSSGENPASGSLPPPPPVKIPTDALKSLTQPQ